MRSFAELEAALSTRTNYELQTPPPGGWGLERMQALLAALGHPERGFGFVHIAGTAGKGTTAAALASTLDAAGLTVGLTTSPHLVHVRERIRIGAGPAAPDLWLEAADRTLTAAGTLSGNPTYFELITATAFEVFRMAAVDVAVVEAGLGGRLDATNTVAAPLLSVITRIAQDHTALLGSSLAQIAGEKAGIIKPGAPVVAAPGSSDADAVVVRRCQELSAHLWLLGRDAHVHVVPEPEGGPSPHLTPAPPRTRFRVDTPWGIHHLQGPLPAALGDNLGLVALAAHVLEEAFERPIAEHLDAGVQRLSWRGRFDVIAGSPAIVIAGAHEPASIRALVETHRALLASEPVPALLFGIARDKPLAEVLNAISNLARTVVCCSVPGPRALPATELAKAFAANGWSATAASSVEEGLAMVREQALAGGSHALVAGSLHLAGAVLALLGEDTDRAWR